MSLYLSPNLDFKANEFIEKLDNDCLKRLKTVVVLQIQSEVLYI